METTMKTKSILPIVALLACCQLAFSAATKEVVPNGWLQVTPASIGHPEFTKPSVEKQYLLTLTNTGPLTITIPFVTVHEDSAKPSAPTGWLGYGTLPGDILPGDSATMMLELNNGGVVTSPNPTELFGKLRFHYGPTGDSLDLPIILTVCDTIVFPVWDSVTTQCGERLTIGTNGNLGAHGIGGANLGFPQPSPECDTNGGMLNRGNAAIYLADASPVIVKKNGSNYAASWSIYDGDITSPNGFKPLYPSSTRGSFTLAGQYDGYNTGTFCTVDSLVKLERTIWAPLNSADSCKFVIMRTRVFPYTINVSVPNLVIGDIFDFDLPSDSGEIFDVAGTDPTHRMIYQRGFNSADTVLDCFNNGLRYGGAGLIQMHLKSCWLDSAMYGGYNAANDSFVYPAGTFVPEQLWANMQSTGYSNETRITDLHSMLVYKNGAANAGFTLPANDTLTIYTAIAVVRPTGGTVAQGLDSLKKAMDKAFKWSKRMATECIICGGDCCDFNRGNIVTNSHVFPDLSDLSYLISYLTVIPRPKIYCELEADVNASGLIDLSDLSLLISYFTATPSPALAPCPLEANCRQ
jgi:hypothetical protein